VHDLGLDARKPGIPLQLVYEKRSGEPILEQRRDDAKRSRAEARKL